MANILTLNTLNEMNNLLSTNDNVVIKFSASWCGPCKAMTNIINNLNDDALNDVIFADIDVDEGEFADVLTDMSIRNLPTFIFFKNNTAKNRKVGLVQANEMIDFINENK